MPQISRAIELDDTEYKSLAGSLGIVLDTLGAVALTVLQLDTYVPPRCR